METKKFAFAVSSSFDFSSTCSSFDNSKNKSLVIKEIQRT